MFTVTRALTVIALVAPTVSLPFLRPAFHRAMDLRRLVVVVAGPALIVALTPFLLTLDVFGFIHVAYLGLTVTLPLLGLAVLQGARRRPTTKPVKVLAALALVPAVVGAYATHVAPFRLRTEEVAVTVPPARAGDDSIRVGVIADLQTGDIDDHERGAIRRLNALQPDLVLIAGDLYQGDQQGLFSHLEEFQDLLGSIEAPAGVFAVRGDTDTGDRSDRLVAGLGIPVLDDELAEVRVGDRRIVIGGNRLQWQEVAATRLRNQLAATESDAITILLSHRPDTVLELEPDSRVDLVVAGHTHGGQVVLPFVGPLITMSGVPRAVARGGLHDVRGNLIYLSPGIGMERGRAPQVRFNSPPTVAVVELRG